MPFLFAAAYSVACWMAVDQDPSSVMLYLLGGSSLLSLPYVLGRLFTGLAIAAVATLLGGLLSIIFPPLLMLAPVVPFLLLILKMQRLATMIPIALVGGMLYGAAGFGPGVLSALAMSIGWDPTGIAVHAIAAIGGGILFLGTNLVLALATGQGASKVSVIMMGFVLLLASMLLGADDLELDADDFEIG